MAKVAAKPDLVALEADDLEPVGLVNAMTVVPGLIALPGYDTMVGNLRRWFGPGLKVVDYRSGVPIPADTDVLRVPYDFRRSVVDAAEALARAVAETEAAGRGVVVLAHSMGGVVARYWIGALDGARRCRALITLGTPHRGAPKALDVLVNGLGLGRLRHPAATRVLRGWPSMHELLPQYPAIWNGDRAIEPVQLPATCAWPAGDQAAGARLLDRVGTAVKVHDDITAAWQAQGLPEVAPFYARGHSTPNRADLLDGVLRVTKVDPDWRGNVGWRGDGTVPVLSALPVELGEFPGRWHAAPDKHGPLGGTAGVRDLLLSFLGEPVPTRAGDAPDRPWIGFDLDDVAWAGDEVLVGADVLGDVEGPGVAATVTAAGLSVPMRLHDGRWRATLPPLPPGVHEVVVEAREAHYGASVWGKAPLVVTEPNEGWEDGKEETR
ncbi:lipase/acyltransferase domain-containing protein [Saccharothrix sp. NRRL B-16348]|uniref:lipase/acyltransferase domain-containing protein n=1 Tax=Saccharothrix sp. NRRL B-16348 TaxID=1415542 RepID=UPI0018D0DB28|nr:hypothetical protein [Saccharothrix sp. NRRL B-16348]